MKAITAQPKISVCIPTYEMRGFGAAFLKQCLDILKKQTFKDFDVVISDYSNNSYDCLMGLYFIQKNVHFNFKLEKHFVDSRSQCIGMTIKKSSNSMDNLSPRYDANITLALFLSLYMNKATINSSTGASSS